MNEPNLETLRKIQTSEVSAQDDTLPLGILDFNLEIGGTGNAIERLYYKGDISVASRPLIVGVIGTQDITPDLARNTNLVVNSILNFQSDAVIATGLAKGIDNAAAQSVYDLNERGYQGKVIGVLPTSTDHPQGDTSLALRTATEGILISEYPDNIVTPKMLKNADLFLRRNRIVAALSDVLVIVWGDYVSGTFSTGNWMSKVHKPVICLQQKGRDSGVYQRLNENGKLQNVTSVATTTELTNTLESLFR